MRRLTDLPASADADTIGRLLDAASIDHKLEVLDAGGWELWIHRDEQMPAAREILDDWESDPDPRRFKKELAELGRRRSGERRRQAEASAIQARHERATRPIQPGPASFAIIGIALVCTWLGIAGTDNLLDGLFNLPQSDIVEPFYIDRMMLVSDGVTTRIPFLYSVRQGEVWRLFTPPFVHTGGLIHLVFNAYWMALFGSQIETRKGFVYLLLLVLFTGLASSLGQYTVGWLMTDTDAVIRGVRPDYGLFGRIYIGGPLGGGLSGVVYGLFGFLLVKRRADPLSGLDLRVSTIIFVIMVFFVCFIARPVPDPLTGGYHTVGIVGNIANMAHLFGFLSGGLWGLVSHRIHRSW